MNIVYPTNADLTSILQEKLPVLTMDDPLFNDIMPIDTKDVALLLWEQRDNYTGLTQVRGIDGAPSSVAWVGEKQYSSMPGYYGEFSTIKESEITIRKAMGSFNQPINISDLVVQRQDKLLQRAIDRLRKMGWDLLTTGTFSSANAMGQVFHTDTYPMQTFSAGVSWATFATSTPLADLRTMKLKQRAKGVKFDRTSNLYMNAKTVNNLLSNTNTNDLGGRRTAAGLNIVNTIGLGELNRIFIDQDLPQVVQYDELYIDDAGAVQLFIPDNKGVLVGSRVSGEPVGNFTLTRNASNDNAEPGFYNRVIDSLNTGVPVPRKIDVHMGFNVAIPFWFPGAVVVASL